ncbi:UDP-glucuronosyl/UDP-glucosyltransferase [Trema orientale]|uniref:Glycosyltransferase n=1 Tax=Trema orientale TaxID=63057 RepID=A0A2P5FKD1_TREOI|nr:UDP-glucuronosyl/UDP-glucosyltransferase [Trema orientale]
MEKAELVFIPAPARGHLVSMVELANELLSRDNRFSVTVLVINSPWELTSPPLPANSEARIQFLEVPKPLQLPPLELLHESVENYITSYIASHKSQVKDIIVNRFSTTMTKSSFRLSGLVVDMFCTAMNDVAAELGVPSYLFFASGAGFLGFALYLHSRRELGGAEFEESDPESDIPSYANPVPAKALPSFAFNKRGGFASFASHGGEFRRTKGIIVNTVLELESHAVGSLSDGVTPPVYTVGPLLDLKGKTDQQRCDQAQRGKIMTWLDGQPPKSVVFLCFGSNGTFGAPQLREIATGLERSGQRFLWSVRRAPPQGKFVPEDYADTDDFLPRGFSARTRGKGMLCGWAPQVEVLAHEAIVGFVSHCGWNSILESVWFGVPIATWPMYAEQQINAFQMVRDLELAVELRLDYRRDGGDHLVTAEEIERAVGCVMEGGDGGKVRKRVEEMSEKCRRAVVKGGSSFESFGRFIEAVLANLL